MNECMIIGKVKSMPEVKTTASGRTMATMVIDAERNFRNDDGTIGVDTFQVSIWRGAAEEAATFCKPGSLVAIKGRLTGTVNEKDDRKFYNANIIAEKIDYLSLQMARDNA